MKYISVLFFTYYGSLQSVQYHDVLRNAKNWTHVTDHETAKFSVESL